MKKLQSIRILKRQVETPAILSSIAFLQSKHTTLSKFDDIEDLYFQIDMNSPPAELSGFEHHFGNVSAAFAKLLWGKGVYIGHSVLDDLLFSAFRTTPLIDPIAHALKIIQDNDVHKPGFVLYPIHSLGINGVGMVEFFTSIRVNLSLVPAGVLLRAQTNSLDDSVAFLEAATKSFSIPLKISRDSLEHYERSRSTRWLSQNPLLAVRVRMFSGSYYENQQFLVVKLKLATTLLFMMAGLQSGYAARHSGRWSSSRRINNSQTLDIRHYFVFERPLRGEHLNIKCVPMNVRSDDLSDLSSLPIDLAPKFWSNRRRVVEELSKHLLNIESKYMSLVVLGNETKGMGKAMRKIFGALAFFRRSFKSRGERNEQVANLAFAFEVLLTAHYAKGVGDRVKRRTKLALSGIRGSRRFQSATADLYTARSQFVHGGATTIRYDLLAGQDAFVHVFLGVARKLSAVQSGEDDPIGAILGD